MAERSLFMWNNEYIVSLVAQQRAAVLPLVYAALERNESEHWNPQAGRRLRSSVGGDSGWLHVPTCTPAWHQGPEHMVS